MENFGRTQRGFAPHYLMVPDGPQNTGDLSWLNGVGVVGLDSLSGYPTEVIEMGLRFFVQMHVFIRFN
jgi:hypothetical protein